MKKLICSLIPLFLIFIFEQQSFAASDFLVINNETNSQPTKNYVFTVDPSTDLSTVTYSGNGTMTNKTLNGDQLTITIQGDSVQIPSQTVKGYYQSPGVWFPVEPGNAIWRYNDGVKWQINTADSGGGQKSYDVDGVAIDSNGISQKPANDGSLTVRTIAHVSPDDYAITWVDANNQVINATVDPNSIAIADSKPDPNNTLTIYNGGVTINGWALTVEHNIHHRKYLPITDPPPAGVAMGPNVIGVMYAAKMVYYLSGTTFPQNGYTYGGAITYSTTAPPPDTGGGGTPPPPASKQPPVAIIDAPSTGSKNQSMHISGAKSYDPDGTIVDYKWTLSATSTSSYSGTLTGANGGNITWKQSGSWIVFLEVTDNDGLTAKTQKTITIGNTPPVADFTPNPNPTAENYPLQITDDSYDPDGSIRAEQWDAPGTSAQSLSNVGGGGTVTYPAPGTYPVNLKVIDSDGEMTQVTKNITVMSSTPVAVIGVGGTLKENRLVTLDSSGSQTPPPYPINHTKDEWVVTPLTAGVTSADVNMGNRNGAVQDILFKKGGDYKVQLRVHNQVKDSDWVEQTITIQPDLPPVADFTISQQQIYRDPSNANKATFVLTDKSSSPDGDTINQRIWYMYYDSNNDGNFLDETRQVLDSTNQTTMQVPVTDVGRYRFELEVVEGFGQPTLSQFITPSDYKHATTW
jgi:hypothetical protein